MLKLKDRELKDMIKSYDSMKSKLATAKKKLMESKEYYEHIKILNLNMKKLICSMIKNKHDIV